MNAPSQDFITVQGKVGVFWECPGAGCGARSGIEAGPSHPIMNGQGIRLACGKCKTEVGVYVVDGRPRIVTPGTQANRHARRAIAKMVSAK